jgi:opacity protein-like surface antigen
MIKINITKKGNILLYSVLCSVFLISNLPAKAYSSDARQESKFYIGVSGGISLPLKDRFKITEKQLNIDKTVTSGIKKSYLATFSAGYKIAKGSAIEFAIDIKPKFDMHVVLFDNLGSSKTKACANVYMINFVHDLLTLQNFTPYFSAGIGLADIKLKQTAINAKTDPNMTIFKISKNHRKTLAFQAGLGVTYPISQTIALDVSAKIHAIKNVKINYQKFDPANPSKLIDKSTKQHLGMLDVTAGLIFNF